MSLTHRLTLRVHHLNGDQIWDDHRVTPTEREIPGMIDWAVFTRPGLVHSGHSSIDGLIFNQDDMIVRLRPYMGEEHAYLVQENIFLSLNEGNDRHGNIFLDRLDGEPVVIVVEWSVEELSENRRRTPTPVAQPVIDTPVQTPQFNNLRIHHHEPTDRFWLIYGERGEKFRVLANCERRDVAEALSCVVNGLELLFLVDPSPNEPYCLQIPEALKNFVHGFAINWDANCMIGNDYTYVRTMSGDRCIEATVSQLEIIHTNTDHRLQTLSTDADRVITIARSRFDQ